MRPGNTQGSSAATSVPAGHEPPVPAAPSSPLPAELKAWCERLAQVGVNCRDVAYVNLAPWGNRSFNESTALAGASIPGQGPSPGVAPMTLSSPPPSGQPAGLAEVWQGLQARLLPQQPVALARHGQDLVLACLLGSGHDSQRTMLGCLIAPPHNEKIIQLIQLSLGWLQYSVSTDALARGARAARLLELLGHVLSQDKARAAAQEWINRTAAWARAEVPEAHALSLSLFAVHSGTPKWWVSADTAWAEHGSPTLQEELELAALAALETQEQSSAQGWAMPLLQDGEVVAVMVARAPRAGSVAAVTPATPALPQPLLDILRASAALTEPPLRRWRDAERPLWMHAWATLSETRRKLTTQGHLTWKVGAIALVVSIAILTLWPVDDRVKANLVIEGRVRQVVTAPFQGFVAKALVRPGDRVLAGQELARLDDRELLIERAKQRSAFEQAEGRLRQAMGQREAAASSQAAAELRQAQAQLALVESRIDRAVITAPMGGLVVSGDWSQQIGAPIENGKELFEIAAEQGYRVVLHVADSDIARVKQGQEGQLRLTGQPDRSHVLRVARVTATASVVEGVNGFRVEAEWRGQVPALSPGMQGVGKIVVGQTNLLTLWTRPLVDWLRLKLWSLW
jgi:multidrug resistance efflux pump